MLVDGNWTKNDSKARQAHKPNPFREPDKEELSKVKRLINDCTCIFLNNRD